MVYDRTWSEAKANPKDILCIGCLSKRLGRKLYWDDFPQDVPINIKIFDIFKNVDLRE
jgi:hypothetical protein